jgi:cytoskeletal protein RodZ
MARAHFGSEYPQPLCRYAWHMIFGEPAVSWPLDKCQLLHCRDSDGQLGQQVVSAAPSQTSSESTRQHTDSAAEAQNSGSPGSGGDAGAMQASAPGRSAASGGDASARIADAAASPSTTHGTGDRTKTRTAADSQPNNREGAEDAGGVGAVGGVRNATAGEKRLLQVDLQA